MKKAASRLGNSAASAMGLSQMQTLCVGSVIGGITESMACAGCISAATGTAGAIAALCKLPCGVAGGSLATAIISCRGN